MKSLYVFFCFVVLSFNSLQADERKFIFFTDMNPDERLAPMLLAQNIKPSQLLTVVTTAVGARDTARQVFDSTGFEGTPVEDWLAGDLNARQALRSRILDLFDKHFGIEILLASPADALVQILAADFPATYKNLNFDVARARKINRIFWVSRHFPEVTTDYTAMPPYETARLLELSAIIPMTAISSPMIVSSFGGARISADFRSYPAIIALMRNLSASHQAFGGLLAPGYSQLAPLVPSVIAAALRPGFIAKSRKVRMSIEKLGDLQIGYRFKVDDDPTSQLEMVESVEPKVFERFFLDSFGPLLDVKAAAQNSPLIPATAHADSILRNQSGNLKVAYVTDLGGDDKKFLKYLEGEPAFQRGSDGLYHLRPNHYFVYGGNAESRGEDSDFIAMNLVRIKNEAPNRVALIAGSHDILKIQLRAELSKIGMRRPPRFEEAKWIEFMRTNLRIPFDFSGDIKAEILSRETQVDRLQFLLAHTLGAPQAFEFKRAKLAQAWEIQAYQVRADAVLKSFWEVLGEDGIHREYLGLLQLGVVLDGTLYTHTDPSGAFKIFPKGFGSEGNPHAGKNGWCDIIPRDLTVRDWIDWMNKSYRDQIRAWMVSVDSWDGSGAYPGDVLIQYARGSTSSPLSNPQSLLFFRNLDEFGKPQSFAGKPREQSNREGIYRFVSGLDPIGDIPFLLRDYEDDAEYVWGNTSNGNNKPVFIRIQGGALEVEADGHKFVTRIGYRTPIGQTLPDNSVIVAKRGPDEWISFNYGPKGEKKYMKLKEPEQALNDRCRAAIVTFWQSR